ncbi:MAG: type II toxin-antitoxin system VapC family toxin, partial [Chloroflexota bacterium]
MTNSQVYYLDTSALVKRYAREDGSTRVQALCEDEGCAKVIGHIGLVETIAALSKKRRRGELTEDRCAQLVHDFLRDAQNRDYVFVVIDDSVINQAADLAQ